MTKLLPAFARKLCKLPLTVPLQFGFIRRRLAYELKQHWFRDLDLEIPIADDFYCPIRHSDSVYSFSEIFVSGEYGNFLEEIPLPRRWLDLGCHTGYFTLFLAWKNAVAGHGRDWRALLIDADPRMEPMVRQTLARNGLLEQARFRLGMITDSRGQADFALRSGMGSTADLNATDIQAVCRVPAVTAEEILAEFPPPYDLIKIDIEGAEDLFLSHFYEVVRHAGALLLEWHSPGRDGSMEPILRAQCEQHGFFLARDLRPVRRLLLDGKWSSSGIQLYRRISVT